MKATRAAIMKVIEPTISGHCRQAIVYLAPDLVVTATRRHKPKGRRATRNEVLLTIGQPNYLARRFIAACKKAGEPFPVKRVQFKHYPVKAR